MTTAVGAGSGGRRPPRGGRRPHGRRLRAASLAALLLAVPLAAAGCGDDEPRSAADLYADFCGRCHGADGRGDPKKRRLKPGLDLTVSSWVAAGDEAEIRRRIADGHGSMPGFSRKLSAEEIDAVVTYLERFRPPASQGVCPRPPRPTK